MSQILREILLFKLDALLIKEDQKAKLNGVMKMAAEVVNAVKLTERAAFPPANLLMKLLMFPPGQQATKIMPKAILGLGSNIKIRIKVMMGKMTHCDINPIMEALGFNKTLLKSSTFKSSATPNMIKPSKKFNSNKLSLLKLSATSSISISPIYKKLC
jgi:hypothetical protein